MKTQREKHAELFAEYMIEAMARTRLRQADIVRLTGLSRATVSSLVGKKPNSVTGKLMLPERETVDKIARAFGDPIAVARQAAGYSVEEAPPDRRDQEPDQRAEEAACTAELVQNWMEMSPDEQARALAMIKLLRGKHPESLDVLGSSFKVT